MMSVNETHDPALSSWVVSANLAGCDFPIQNLPFAVFRRRGGTESFRGGVAIGTQILDLAAASGTGAFSGLASHAAATCASTKLNALMALGPSQWSALRLALSRALRAGSEFESRLPNCLLPQSDAEYDVPAAIGDYTDFYTSIHHATNVGKLFRPDNPLLPNYKWIPIGYHGRSSSIRVSGQAFPRPRGQIKLADTHTPELSPSKRMDYELELGVFIGPGNELGQAIPIDAAESHIFGLCLLNDWSARDIQAWEYQPLGPFLSKNFASTISPWIVTMEALAPHRIAWERAAEDPQPMAYLDSGANRREGALDIQLQVLLQSARMRDMGIPATALAQTSFKHAYWSLAQMVTHHAVNGCNLQPGDFLGSGTESGPTAGEAGSLLELTLGGARPFDLPCGERRTFLEDGDMVVMRAWCERDGAARIGFGDCVGTLLPANNA